MADRDIALMAHLMRRAGFGATYDELEARVAKGYEATVDELLHPEEQPNLEMDILERYLPDWVDMTANDSCAHHWTYFLIHTPRLLQEKMALFWHGILCTGIAKAEDSKEMSYHLDRYRRHGMGSFPNLLLELSRSPQMVYYLDNCMSHKDAINENYGRELLELFSMGVGMDGQPNYTEDDVQVCARAFTGWTITNAIPRYPYGRYELGFLYNPDDHDGSEKTFLSETGRWNGEDVIDIIARHPGTARFISRHLYNFFVADDPQVPAWQDTPPQDPEAIKILEEEYFRSNYDIRSMLMVLFHSEFFKKARFAKVKSPAETVVGTMRLVGGLSPPKVGIHRAYMEMVYMGQDLINPPTVEGWHTGKEWIDTGTLVERINFTADQVGNTDLPGVRLIIDRLSAEGPTMSPERLVDGCLDMLGAYELAEETRSRLRAHAEMGGELCTGTEEFGRRVGQMLQLIVATQEYQFA